MVVETEEGQRVCLFVQITLNQVLTLWMQVTLKKMNMDVMYLMLVVIIEKQLAVIIILDH